jgi:hypothetical protein
MMPRSKEPERKLAEFRKQAQHTVTRKEVRESVVEWVNGILVEKECCRHEGPTVDWSLCPPDARAAEANRATTLLPFSYDQTTVRGFFEEFKRDPQNPWHWRELFYYLIEAHSRKPKRMQWSELKLSELLMRSEEYRKEQYPHKISDSKILKNLRRDFKRDYEHVVEDGSLRKRLKQARDRWPDLVYDPNSVYTPKKRRPKVTP